jgi:hypothetical protein
MAFIINPIWKHRGKESAEKSEREEEKEEKYEKYGSS